MIKSQGKNLSSDRLIFWYSVMTEYDELMIEINEYLNDLIYKVESSDVASSSESISSWKSVGKSLDKYQDKYQDPPETIPEKLIVDSQGVKWLTVKALGLPGVFVRRLHVIKAIQDCMPRVKKPVTIKVPWRF